MAGPAHPLRVALLAVFASVAQAQTTAPMTAASPEPAATSKLDRLFSGAPPKYNPPKPEAAPAPPAANAVPRNRIIRLPTYDVHDKIPVPDEYEILTQKGRNAAMAKRYLGTQNGLDRALNSVTLAGLWKSIPLLGRIPFVPFGSMTYEERAALIYERPEQKRRFDELMSIEQFAREADKAKSSAKSTK